MKTTIDGAGRVVIPKSIRDSAGITAGTQLEIVFRDGRIEVEIPTVAMKLSVANGLPVISGPPDVRPMSASVTDTTLQAIRLIREQVNIGNASGS